MITAVKDKNKTTITIPRRLSKKELERLSRFIDTPAIQPATKNNKKSIQALADEITGNAWKKFGKQRGLL